MPSTPACSIRAWASRKIRRPVRPWPLWPGFSPRIAPLPDGDRTVRIEQGYEMGRPSLITLGLTLRGGKLAAASVGGEAVVVTEGTIEA